MESKPPRTCDRCGKTCSTSWNLQRHLARASPCVRKSEVAAAYQCACGLSYVHEPSLRRHQRACRPPGLVIEQGTRVVNSSNVQVHNGSNIQMHLNMGWPEAWGAPPAVIPHPFDPPSCTIPLDLLLRALDTGDRAGAGAETDPDALVRFLMKLVKALHESPQERNLYLSTNRADQVIARVPTRWQIAGLGDSIKLLLETLLDGMGGAEQLASPAVRAVTAGVREGCATQREQVVRRLRAPLSAHLEDLRAGGETWLGAVSPEAGARRPRYAGRANNAPLSAAAVAAALEQALGLYDAMPMEPQALAKRAVHTFARLMITGHPENITTLAVGRGALTHLAAGWQAEPVETAAARLFARMADLLEAYLRALAAEEAPPALLAALAGHLADARPALEAEEVATQEILGQFTRAANRFEPLRLVAEGAASAE